MTTGSKVKVHILRLIIFVCVVVFATSAYMLVDYVLDNKKVEDDYDVLRVTAAEVETDDYKEMLPVYQDMHMQNNDFIGWLSIYNTKIDYPVMQTPDDEQYYLYKNFKKKDSAAGALFASAHSNLSTPSDIVTIYGHNMRIGTMFGKLGRYTKPEYLADHKYIRLDTLKERHTYEICALFTVSVAYDNEGNIDFGYHDVIDFPGEDAYNKYMEKVKKFSIYETGVEYKYGDKFILLSTCEYTKNEGRLVVMAKKIPNEEAPEFPKPDIGNKTSGGE